jgi:hypothetical protein
MTRTLRARVVISRSGLPCEAIVVSNAPNEAVDGDGVGKRWGHSFALEGGDLVGDGGQIGIHFQ